MREFNALKGYPEPKNPRSVGPKLRTIKNRIMASYRGKEYYDGERDNGYGGFRYDGRWKVIAENMFKEYRLKKDSPVLQIGCEKGFLLHDFQALYPEIKIAGTEISDYAIQEAMPPVKPFIQKAPFAKLPFKDRMFDLVIAVGVVYTLTLSDAMECLREIERVGRGKSFVTLGAYNSEEERRLFHGWTLLGTTILHMEEWKEVLKEAGYTGDYWFCTSKTLRLIEKKN